MYQSLTGTGVQKVSSVKKAPDLKMQGRLNLSYQVSTKPGEVHCSPLPPMYLFKYNEKSPGGIDGITLVLKWVGLHQAR